MDNLFHVQVAWNGICGSDLHGYLMEIPGYPTATKGHTITGETAPVTLGHEFSGTVSALGPGVDQNKFAVGQRVCVEPLISCQKHTCGPCAAGSRNVCPVVGFIGISGRGGGLSEYITVDQDLVHLLPDNVSLEVGACIEPLAVAWHAVKQSGYVKGNTALIVGSGPIGLFLLKVLRSIDPASAIIVSEPTSLRRERAQTHGATLVVNPLEVDLHAAVLGATNNKGVDVAYDAAGIKASLEAAMLCVRPRGLIMNVAIWETNPNINMNLMVMKEIRITGALCYDRIHPELIEAMAAGKIPDVEDLITRKIPIEEVVQNGFEKLLHEKDKQIKILVTPGAA
ncbi:hypothetical protein HGRIS_012428 [Hohenbuehelia grisea]|uniref:Enoyl reductase (ER) domain-containing protein n=1 Tax=Hohenbuehelia grisea TaxID=104357 RepID=A0ABR3IS80_9AGAR